MTHGYCQLSAPHHVPDLLSDRRGQQLDCLDRVTADLCHLLPELVAEPQILGTYQPVRLRGPPGTTALVIGWMMAATSPEPCSTPSTGSLEPHRSHSDIASTHVDRRQARASGKEQDQPPSTKRRRIGYACNLCRAKKNRCDGERPTCGACRERRQECVYSPHRTKISVTQEYLENLRARNRALEEHLAGQRIQGLLSQNDLTCSKEPPFGLSRLPEIQDEDENDDQGQPQCMDQQTTMARSNGRPEALPRHHQEGPCPEDQQPPSKSHGVYRPGGTTRTDHQKGDHPGEYFGESSAFDFFAKVASPNTAEGASSKAAKKPALEAAGPSPPAVADTEALAGESESAHPAACLAVESAGSGGCMNICIDSLAASTPSTIVFEDFLGISIGGAPGANSSTSDLFELPQRSLADRLVGSYFKYRHPLNPYLHEGSFRLRYSRLWLSQEVGGEEAAPNNLAWFGLVNMVFAFGSEHVQPVSGNGTKLDRARFFKRAKTLIFSSILQAKIELIQALLLMSHYLHGSLELNHCWTVIGLATRTAQELGLYLDPVRFTTDVVEQEIRKRLWWGCFVLERNLSIKVGRPPTIQDVPTMQVGLPLAVDDEFLDEASDYTQPSHVPSKLEFFNQIVAQCRLVERVLNTLYDNSTDCSSPEGRGNIKARGKHSLPELLATSVQLDGALVAWQNSLPTHLHPDSDAHEWHFERQRNVLLMRFLHTRLLIHRQTLLHYISRRISDPFQIDLVYPCIRRCVMAACDSIIQARLLRQYNLLSSSWHNSHHVFSALGVLLVFQNLDPYSRSRVDIAPFLDMDNIISQGIENLQRVGGEMHPLASRYTRSFEQLRQRLQAVGTLSANAPLIARQNHQNDSRENGDTSLESAQVPQSKEGELDISRENTGLATQLQGQGQNQEASGGMNCNDKENVQEQSNATRAEKFEDDGFVLSGFDDEFAMIQSVLLDGNEWGQGYFGQWE